MRRDTTHVRRGVRAVKVALLAIALSVVLLWSAPTEAQTEPVLVTNTAQTSSGTGSLSAAVFSTYAQGFTTGPNPNGYRLSHVGISLSLSSPSAASSELEVRLHAAGSGTGPGDALCTLADPPTFKSSGVHYFSVPPDAAGCSTLTRDTTYDIVIERVSGTTGTTEVAFTDTNAQDDGAQAGFSIDDTFDALAPTNTWTQVNDELQIEVGGEAVPSPVLVTNTAQTSSGTGSLSAAVFSTYAQGFTTGPNPNGYRLSHVGISLSLSSPSAASSELEVRLHAAGSGTGPGDALCTLADPPTFKSSGVHYFSVPPDAAGCSTLTRDTTYDIVIERVSGTTGTTEVAFTDTNAQDDGAQAGFSIDDTFDALAPTNTWTQVNDELQIEVGGEAVPSPVLVTNTAQTSSGTGSLSAAVFSTYAQGFTTGPNPNGYRLSHVGISLSLSSPSAASSELEVRLHAAGSGTGPGDALCTLADPPTFKSSGVHYFSVPPDAAGCSTLTRDTTYDIVIERVSGTTGTTEVAFTDTNAQDDGAQAGFSIDDTFDALAPTNTWTQVNDELQIEVGGEAVPSPVLVTNTAQTSSGTGSLSAAVFSTYAQGFTTGPNPNGYRLSHVGISLSLSSPSAASSELEVRLHAAGSGTGPGDALCTLADPPTFKSSGVHYFSVPPDAAGCSTLTRDTTYDIVIERVSGTTGTTEVAFTDTNAQDDGAQAGFSIDDTFDALAPTNTWTQVNDELQIEVGGEAVPSPVLVTNTAQTSSGTGSLSAAVFSTYAQGFTTGPNPNGYRLSHVGISLSLSSPSAASSELEVRLHAAGSGTGPGDALCTLADPPTFKSSGVHYFSVPPDAAGCSTLTRDTTYDIVIERVSGTTGTTEVAFTDTNAQDDGAQAGFSIDDTFDALTPTNTWTQVNDELQIEVGGSIAATGVPVITGIPEVYETLTADISGIDDVDGIAGVRFSYQWIRVQDMTETEVGSDSPAYSLGVADIGKLIKVRVTFTDDVGSKEIVVSAPVGPVANPAGVSPSQSTLSVVEGSSAVYTLVLDAEPSSAVTVDISGGGDVTVDPTSLTFTAADWDMEQSVTVTAAGDVDTVNDTVSVTHAIRSGSAAEYIGLSIDSVAVTVNDNDTAGVSVSRQTLRVDEEGSGIYTVRLAFQPTDTVTVDVTGGGDVTVVPASLVFTTDNWDTTQTVTVTAAGDHDAVDDVVTVTHTVDSSRAPEYVGLSVDSVAVTVVDDDDPAVTVSFDQESYSVAEGRSVTIRVRLSAVPQRTVVVPITATHLGGVSSSDYSGVPASVSFGNGDSVRSFVFRAAVDRVQDAGESVRLGFGTLPARVTAGATSETVVSITDVAPPNRSPSVSATGEPDTVLEGATVTLDGTADDPDGDALSYLWTSDGGGEFVPGADQLDTGWVAPTTDTAVTVSLTLTVTDVHGASASFTVSVVVEPATEPNAASGLDAVVAEDNSVLLSWTLPDQSPDVTIASVQIQQRMGGGGLSVPTWDTVATLGASAVTHTVEDLGPDETEWFRVRLTSNHDLSADSRPLRVRTLTQAPALVGFEAQWPTQTSITLGWTTVETAAQYKLEYRKHGQSDWNRIDGDFDDLPSSSDLRWAFGVAAGLECNTVYEFRVSARGSGTQRDDYRTLHTTFGPHATTTATTGQCPQPEHITNLLASIEPDCATLTWTPPSGDRDSGYRVERYSYTHNPTQRSEPVTLVEHTDQIADRYQDCSAAYRTDGADHVWIVTALANNPGPDQDTEFGAAYTPLLAYGPSQQPQSPRNIRLTHDTPTSRTLAWDTPLDPWLTTLKTARTGPGPQQSVTDPWITGYRIERAEYRTNDHGDWYLPDDGVWETLRDETDVDTATTHTDATDQDDTRYVYRVWAYNNRGPNHYTFDDDWAFNGASPEPTE